MAEKVQPPIPEEIKRIAEEFGIDTILNLDTGEHRDVETGAIVHRITPRTQRPALAPENQEPTAEFSLQT